MKYNPALDGLRALAAFFVVCHHSYAPFATGGFVGVDLFFVLSGYLITQSLAERPGLYDFYIRRARRLVPALAFMLVGYVVAMTYFSPERKPLIDAAIAFFYLSDYTFTLWSIPSGLVHTWSLAVEEHFYLLWPLIFLRFRPTVRVLLVAYIVATAWRMGWPWELAYYRFDTRMSGLILGCALAATPRWNFPAWPGIAGLAILCLVLSSGTRLALGPGIMLAEISAAIAIMGVPPRWISLPTMTYLGRISYGIYLWHFPISFLLRPLGWPLVLLLTTLLSIAAAALSYHFVEVFFRNKGKVRVLARAPEGG
jgi:peptidoglycan/LPS O-acetylase OafA/YrhL